MKGYWKTERSWKDIMFPETGDGYKAVGTACTTILIGLILYGILYGLIVAPITVEMEFSGDGSLIANTGKINVTATHIEGSMKVTGPAYIMAVNILSGGLGGLLN